jgi:hypothetical protein
MTLADFVLSLSLELRLRGEPFDRADLETFARDVWPLVEDPDPARWATEFLEERRAGVRADRTGF